MGLDDLVERVCERVAIKVDAGIAEMEAARQTCQEYGIPTMTHWDYAIIASGIEPDIARLLRHLSKAA